MALPTGLKTAGGKAVAVVILVFMALLSFRGISTPSLLAQGEQRRPSFFNIRRDIPPNIVAAIVKLMCLRIVKSPNGRVWTIFEGHV
jgi:hypothetical protein